MYSRNESRMDLGRTGAVAMNMGLPDRTKKATRRRIALIAGAIRQVMQTGLLDDVVLASTVVWV